jgi:hypothetical protein
VVNIGATAAASGPPDTRGKYILPQGRFAECQQPGADTTRGQKSGICIRRPAEKKRYTLPGFGRLSLAHVTQTRQNSLDTNV